jgi:hypothetical protein
MSLQERFLNDIRGIEFALKPRVHLQARKEDEKRTVAFQSDIVAVLILVHASSLIQRR